MHISVKFFKNIYKEDILYHYTKASTAIDFILYDEKLRFNESRKSNDPIESRTARRGTLFTGREADRTQEKQEMYDSQYLHEYISNLENQFYQICFCKNKMGDLFANEGYFSDFNGHEELFGFTKLRMWEQYGDNYSGVCLAYSLEKILALNDGKIELMKGDVNYLTFQNLANSKIGDIQFNHLLNVGKEKYKEQIYDTVKRSFFIKHKDYLGENEYRIGTLYDKNKCFVENIRGEWVFDRTMMLDVAGCVETIFISSYTNYKQKSELLKYANTLDVPIVEMEWRYNSFVPRDYKASTEFFNKLQFNQLNKKV